MGQVNRFVIQRHQATTLHYDLRLEAGGVLKSWAVPKEPSTDPAVKRLAVQVYESDRVSIWDRGTYRPITEGPVEEAIENGHLSFELDGERLRGGWTLQRTSDGRKPQWLLIKRRDA